MFRKVLAPFVILAAAAILCAAARVPVGLTANAGFSFPADSVSSSAQGPDSTALAALDAKLSEYLEVLTPQVERVKEGECDFLIESTEDSLLRQRIALKIYDFYITSHVMGDEAVAIHVFDKWFADGKVAMLSDIDLMNARIFADFNRNSLLGCTAPRLSLLNMGGGIEQAPAEGRISVLFFYDTGCTKCKVETILMKQLLQSGKYSFDFFAIYTGASRPEWETFIEKNYSFETPGVTVHHLWDPDLNSDYHRLYGVLQTPRIFMVAPDGEIIGRGLDTEATIKLLPYGTVFQELYDRCPVGEKLPDVSVSARLLTGKDLKSSSSALSGDLTTSDGGSSVLRSAGKIRIWSLRKFKGSPGYVLFYSRTCTRCQAQLAKVDSVLAGGRKTKILLVDMDRLQREHPEMAQDCLDSFDLTVFPKIIRVDRRGRVLSRSDEF